MPLQACNGRRGRTFPNRCSWTGSALPVGELEIQRWCKLEGESIPLARLGEDEARAPILVQSLDNRGGPGAYFLAILPSAGTSSLARDGVVLYAMLHRALSEGAASLGTAQQRDAGPNALADDPFAWKRLTPDAIEELTTDRPLRSGVFEHQTKPIRIALNRPSSEDISLSLNQSNLEELFSGLDWRLLERTLENEKSLTNEVWRTFLLLMAAAIVSEALLCMPRRREPVATRSF